MAITVKRELRDGEPSWGKVDKTKLPREAFAHVGDPKLVSTWSYPYMWIVGGSKPDENGRYTNGTLYIHRGGLGAAWAAAQGARTGKKASSQIIGVLEKARKAIGLDEENVRKNIPIKLRVLKRDTVNRVVVGVVYEPYVVDAQGHFASPETIERACHRFMLSGGVAGTGHDESVTNVQIRKSGKRAVVENYIAPVDMHFGGETIKAGSWVMGVKVFDDEEWGMVERGELNGYSMHGAAWARA